MLRHVSSVHKGNKPHKCSICDYSTSSRGDLKQHIEAIHEKKKPHKCPICDHSFSEKHHVKRHMVSAHNLKKDSGSINAKMNLLSD